MLRRGRWYSEPENSPDFRRRGNFSRNPYHHIKCPVARYKCTVPAGINYGRIFNLLPFPDTIIRAGIVPFTKMNGEIFLCFGIDSDSNELTDFGGHRKLRENIVTTAYRELYEESLNCFYQGIKDTIYIFPNSYAAYNNQMLIIFTEVKSNLVQESVKLFEKATIGKPKKLEVSGIIWFPLSMVINLLTGPDFETSSGPRFYKKVRDILLQVPLETLLNS